jgi:hypothetical protein
MSQSPEVVRARDIDNTNRCDACGCTVNADAPVLFVQAGYGSAICLPCIRWAMPQMEALEAKP